MKQTTRRDFLKQSGGFAAGSAALSLNLSSRAADANGRLVLGMIGPGGMGMNHIRALALLKDIAIAYVCDPDENRRNKAADDAEKLSGSRPKAVADMRRVFEDKSVDAVFIATPDHWHAPATLLACEAGKHVYVEKPCAHNLREGRLMLEAARRHNRVVQVGTQSRSTGHVRRAMELIHGGAIGEVLVAKVWNSQLRGNIGHAKPSAPPAHLDFDLWLGPVPAVPYQSNLLHSSWRWFHDFGAGDMGNDGSHDLDIGRWGLGVETHPSTVTALGGKYFFDDDQQFPDTQTVVFEYASDEKSKRPRQLIYEQRLWSPYVQEGHENGDAFYGTKGMLVLGKQNGWKLYGPRNELRDQMSGSTDLPAHHRNFLDCVKSGSRPHADIEIGHYSGALCHLGNIATRLGRTLNFDPKTEMFLDDPKAARMVRRTYRPEHWAVPKGV